jgi:fucose 4-O-acetylase-like acetyltransferase
MNKRIELFDFMRGIAIILVVLYHIILRIQEKLGLPGFLSEVITICDYIQMPIFFFISGFFSRKEIEVTKAEYGRYFKRKVNRLLLPYISSCCLIALFDLLLVTYYPNVLSTNFTFHSWFANFLRGSGEYVNQYWYLYILFVISMIFPLLKKVYSKLNKSLTLIILFIISTALISLESFYFVSYIKVAYYFVFFYLGSIFEVNVQYMRRNIYWTLFLILAFFVSNIFFNSLYIKTSIGVLISISGIYLLFLVSGFILKNINESKITTIGVKSMSIYLFHTPFFVVPTILILSKLHISVYIIMFVSFLISVTGPVFISDFAFKKSKLFNRLFMGNRI